MQNSQHSFLKTTHIFHTFTESTLKTQIRLKRKSSKIAHFPIKNYLNLHFTTTPQNHFFPSVPHTYFATKFRTKFNFIEVFTDNKPDICATIIQNTSKHVASLPTGHIGYIEVPITNEKT